MNIEVLPVERDHIGDWLRLRNAVYTGIDQEFHYKEMELFLADDTKKCFLAMADTANICGMVEVSLRNIVDGCLTSPVGCIEGIYVDPKFRGIGIARRLVGRAENWCPRKDVRKWELTPNFPTPMPNDFMRRWDSRKRIGSWDIGKICNRQAGFAICLA